MAASWDDCGSGLRFDIPDRRCALWPVSEGLALGEFMAGSHRSDCRTRLLLVTRSIEQRTLNQIWLDDPQHDQSSQAMARIELKNWGLPLVAPNGHGAAVAAVLLLGQQRTTFARRKYFAF